MTALQELSSLLEMKGGRVRKVATDAGVAKYHLPKGSVIGEGKPDFKIKHVYVHHSSEPGDDSRAVRYVGMGNKQHIRVFPDAEAANKHQDDVEDEQLGPGKYIAHTFHVIDGRIHRISSGIVHSEGPNGLQEETGMLTYNSAGKPVVYKKVGFRGPNKYEHKGKSFPTLRQAILHLAGDPNGDESYEFEGKREPLHQTYNSKLNDQFRTLGPDEPRLTPDGQPIPPAVKNVEVAKDENNNASYRGVNDIGEVVSGTSYAAKLRGDEEKWARIKEWDKHVDKLDAALTPKELRDNPTAAVVRLMREGSRVDSGNDPTKTVKGHKTYGASSVLAKHVTIRGNIVTFEFHGKDNVLNTYKIRDADYAAAMANHLRGKRGDDEVFPGVNDKKTMAYIKHHSGMPNAINHDLRTYQATSLAAHLIHSTGPRQLPKTAKEYNAQRRYVGEQVAAKLNNEPTQALNNYISPVVLEALRAKLPPEEDAKVQKSIDDAFEKRYRVKERQARLAEAGKAKVPAKKTPAKKTPAKKTIRKK